MEGLTGHDFVRCLQSDFYPYPEDWARGIVVSWKRTLTRVSEIAVATLRLTNQDLVEILRERGQEWHQLKAILEKANKIWRHPAIPGACTIQALSGLLGIAKEMRYLAYQQYLTALLEETTLKERDQRGVSPE